MELDVEALNKMTPDQQEQVLKSVRQQAAIMHAQTLIADLTDKCITKCVPSPGTSLTGSEKQCLQRCMDRFVESWNTVSATLQKRIQLPSSYGGADTIEYAEGPSFS